jgi:hypothetical protein
MSEQQTNAILTPTKKRRTTDESIHSAYVPSIYSLERITITPRMLSLSGASAK